MLLKQAEGRILALELSSGEQFFAEIVMVVDEPPTPDVFVLPVEREPDGAFTATTATGKSFSAGGDRPRRQAPGCRLQLESGPDRENYR